MRNIEKDSINWLMNQEDARALVKAINPREFTIIEAVVLDEAMNQEDVLAENDKMFTYDNPTEGTLDWLTAISHKLGHEPGKKYIYFRFKRFN